MDEVPMLDLDDIQGDVAVGLQKDVEEFVFFKILDKVAFKRLLSHHVVGRITSARVAQQRELTIARKRRSQRVRDYFPGLNLGISKDGMTQLLGARRPAFDPSFERGADHPETIAALNDPGRSAWLTKFVSDRIDGVFLITGHNRVLVAFFRNQLLQFLGGSIKIVYSETGNTRPDAARGHEHFGFLDGISQPGIRGLARVSRPHGAPNQGHPGQDLIWPGEFILGHPGQDPRDPVKPGPVAPLPAPWARNGTYMVVRRLEQLVPEFRNFVSAHAQRFGISAELMAARMVGRWRSGAPLELAPLRDNAMFSDEENRNNDFSYADDPFQRACPFAAHIRKTNPRDDLPGGRAEVMTHRIIRTGIPFGPEVMPGETRTQHRRGLMFVCYQASIQRQFEHIQSRWANDPDFIGGKARPDGAAPAIRGFDPIIGQAPGGGPRTMDEPAPNYPTGNRRTTLEMPQQFVVLTAAGYFFVPSLMALRTVLT